MLKGNKGVYIDFQITNDLSDYHHLIYILFLKQI